jgi:hypothetical protein
MASEEKVDIEKWLDYERDAGGGLSHKAMTLLCLYDLNLFPEWVIRELLESHSHAAIGFSASSRNPGAPALILDRGMGIIHRKAGPANFSAGSAKSGKVSRTI